MGDVHSLIYATNNQTTDTVEVNGGNPYYKPISTFLLVKDWNLNTDFDTLKYEQASYTRFKLSSTLFLENMVNTSTADSSTAIRFRYLSTDKQNHGYGEVGLAFVYKGGAFNPLNTVTFNTDAQKGKIPKVNHINKFEVHGITYKDIYIFEVGVTIHDLTQPDYFINPNRIKKMYWASGVGPIFLVYENGTKQSLLTLVKRKKQ